MTDRLIVDIESRSAADLKKVGGYVYAADPTTSVTHLGWKLNGDPVRVWRPGQGVIPNSLADAFADASVTLVAHNAQFERTMLGGQPGRAIGLGSPLAALERWSCIAARAAAVGLPRDLERCTKALRLTSRKDAAGHKVMLRVSRPRTRDPLTWWEDDERMEIMTRYRAADVLAEAELDRVLPPLSPMELKVWRATETLNDAGVLVDQELLARLIALAEQARRGLDTEMRRMTDGAVPRVTNAAALAKWLVSGGVDVDGAAKDVVAALLEDDGLPEDVCRASEIRQEGGGSSSTKVAAIARQLAAYSRIHGALVYAGASSTGRWSSNGCQLQNMARHDDRYRPAALLRDLECDATLDELAFIHGAPLKLVSELTRPVLIAAPGQQLVWSDYSQIESRILAWLAGQEDKLEAFRAYDAGTGPDLYRVTAGRVFNVRPGEVTPAQRQSGGKVTELACGFGGGVKALRKMAKNYSVEMNAEDAERIKLAWRAAHPYIQQFWYDLENVIREILLRPPGDVLRVGCLRFYRVGQRVVMRLPSGRAVRYWDVRLKEVEVPWGGTRWQPHYWSLDAVTRQWAECAGYGGLFAENATQAVARDILAEALVRLDAAGHRVVLLVHDEAIVETATNTPIATIDTIMRTPPTWANGLPIAVEVSAGPRYLKE